MIESEPVNPEVTFSGIDIEAVEAMIAANEGYVTDRAVSLLERLTKVSPNMMKRLGLRQMQADHFMQPLFDNTATPGRPEMVRERRISYIQLAMQGHRNEAIRRRLGLASINHVEIEIYNWINSFHEGDFPPAILRRRFYEVLTPKQQEKWRDIVATAESADLDRQASPSRKPKTTSRAAARAVTTRSVTSAAPNIPHTPEVTARYTLTEALKKIIEGDELSSEYEPLLLEYFGVRQEEKDEAEPDPVVQKHLLARGLNELSIAFNRAASIPERAYGELRGAPKNRALTTQERQIMTLLLGNSSQGIAPRSVTKILELPAVKRAGIDEAKLAADINSALNKIVSQ